MSSEVLPYLAAKIERNFEGEARAARRVAGVGLQIPEDELDPFPFNPLAWEKPMRYFRPARVGFVGASVIASTLDRSRRSLAPSVQNSNEEY